MGTRILFTGGKGGVGKTTVTANIGFALAKAGKKTVLIDGDIGLNNLDVIVNAEDKILYDIGDVARGKCTVFESLVELTEGLYLLPSVTACSSFVTKELFAEICAQLSEKFDFVLIDSPAGVEEGFLRAAGAATEAVIVATPHIASVRDGYKTGKILSSLGVKKQGLVINRMRGDFVLEKLMLDAEDIACAVKLPLYGVVPEEDYVNVKNLCDFSDKRSAAAYSFSLLAEYLCGKDKKLYDYLSPYRGIGGFFKRHFS